MNDDLQAQLAIARELHARLVPRKGRRARRRLGARDVLRVMQAVTDDPATLATMEVRFLVEELLNRGRHPSGQRVTREHLVTAGLGLEDEPPPAIEPIEIHRTIPLAVVGWTLTTDDVRTALAAQGLIVESVSFEYGCWPAQVDFTCVRKGDVPLSGSIALDLGIDDQRATASAELRLYT